MKKLCKESFLVLIFICLIAFGASGQENSLKVMTFNIRFDNPDDGINRWENRRSLIISALLEEAPDVVGMQEVLVHQADYLDKNLPGYGYVGTGRDDGKTAGEHSPIFYHQERLKVIDWGTFWLSATPGDTGSAGWDAALPRICTWVKFHDTQAGHDFFFLNTHFDHVGSLARIESAKLIQDYIHQQTSGLPVVLTGDFNFSPDEAPYRILHDQETGLQDVCGMADGLKHCMQGTFNGFGRNSGPERIDMIFIKGDWKVDDYKIIRAMEGDMFISDHWPVTADLLLRHDGP